MHRFRLVEVVDGLCSALLGHHALLKGAAHSLIESKVWPDT